MPSADAAPGARLAGLSGLAIGLLVGAILPTLIAHRHVLASGFAILSSETYDGLIARAIQNHWRNVAAGRSHWSEVGYFHPAEGTLAYNDGSFLFGLIGHLLNAAGVDALVATEASYMVARFMGCAAFVFLLHRVFRTPIAIAAIGGLVFGIANGIYIRGAVHAQLLSVYFLPVIAIAAHATLLRLQGSLASFLAWAAATSALTGALLMTSFYTAFFAALLAAGVVAWLAGRAMLADGLAPLAAKARALSPRLVLLALMLAGSAIPFLVLYLPKAGETGMHAYRHALAYAVRLPDIVNVGPDNPVWSGPISALRGVLGLPPLSYSEQSTGFTPLLLLLAALSVWARAQDRQLRWLVQAIQFSSATLLCLSLAVDSVSLWWLIYHVVPGAPAVRVVARSQLVLTPLLILLACQSAAALWRRHRRFGPAAALLLVTAVAAEQANSSFLALTSRAETQGLIDRAAAARRPECRVFVAVNPRPGKDGIPHVDALYSPNVDAMLISSFLAWPTLNGFSSFTPPGWEMAHTAPDTYRQSAIRAAERAGVAQETCALDIQTGAIGRLVP